MLKVSLFLRIIKIISTGIEFIVLKVLLDEISERKSKKIELVISFSWLFNSFDFKLCKDKY